MHFLGLDGRRHVGMDDPNAAHERHCNGHAVFRDRVHGARDKGRLQLNVARQVRFNDNVVKTKGDMAGHENQVIVCVGDAGGVTNEDLGGSETIMILVGGAVVEVDGCSNERDGLRKRRKEFLECAYPWAPESKVS